MSLELSRLWTKSLCYYLPVHNRDQITEPVQYSVFWAGDMERRSIQGIILGIKTDRHEVASVVYGHPESALLVASDTLSTTWVFLLQRQI